MTGSYNVVLKRSAEKELRAIPKPDIQRVVARLQGLAHDPRPRGCEKMEGANLYRVRQGDWRVLYEVDDTAKRVMVVKIGHRREIYR